MKRFSLSKNVLTVVTFTVMLTELVYSQPLAAVGDIDWKKVEIRYVAALLSDNEGVRESAARYVAEYRLTGAINPLIKVLKQDKVESVRMAAALALVTIGDKLGRDAVEEASLYDGSDKVIRFCESLLNGTVEPLTVAQ